MRKIDDYEYLHLLAESRGQESDDLAPARGIIRTCLFSAAFMWLMWQVLRAIR